jgi:hypothetical protein
MPLLMQKVVNATNVIAFIERRPQKGQTATVIEENLRERQPNSRREEGRSYMLRVLQSPKQWEHWKIVAL